MTFTVKGEKELIRAIERSGDREFTKDAKKILRNAAKEIKRDVTARTPKSAVRSRPGKHLVKSYKLKSMARRAGRIGFRIIPGARDVIGIDPDEKWYYPTALEYGFKRKDGYSRPPLKFMRDPVEINAERLSNKIVDELWQAIKGGFER